MSPAEIKLRLMKKGLRQIDLVREWREPKSTISMLVNRKFRSAALEKRLARKLGVKLAELRGESRAA